MRVLKTFASLAHLGRPGMALLTMSIPLIGVFSTGASITVKQGVALALLGLFAHLFGFSLNDIMDRDVDRLSPGRQISPLVRGHLPLWLAYLFAYGVIIPALLLVIWLSPDKGQNTPIILCLLSILFSVVYNLWSKNGPIPPILAELSLASSVALLLLAAAATQSQPLPLLTWIMSLGLFLQLLLVNSVPSGLKDIKTDQEAGIQSFVIWMGTKVCEEEKTGGIIIPNSLRCYSLFLQAGLSIIILTAFYTSRAFNTLEQGILILALIIFFQAYAFLHLRFLLFDVSSYSLLRRAYPLLSGYFNYGAYVSIFLFRLPLWFGLPLIMLIAFPFLNFLRLWRRRFQVLQ